MLQGYYILGSYFVSWKDLWKDLLTTKMGQLHYILRQVYNDFLHTEVDNTYLSHMGRYYILGHCLFTSILHLVEFSLEIRYNNPIVELYKYNYS